MIHSGSSQRVGFNCLTRHIIGYFGGKFYQAIDCTGINNQTQGNKILQTPETQNINKLTKQTKPRLVKTFMITSQEMEQTLFLQPRNCICGTLQVKS